MTSRPFEEALTNVYISRVKLGKSFESHKAILENALDDPLLKNKLLNKDADADAIKGLLDALPSEATKPKRRDTSVGGNEAINCYYQFNEDDDVIHPVNKVGKAPDQGMGRVYNEIFDEQQQLLYMSFGVPQFSDITKFFEHAYNKDLAEIMNTGDYSKTAAIGRFLGKTLGTIILLPILPLRFALDIIVKREFAPSRYYDFKPTMATYYKLVNTILAHIAVNMDLAKMVEEAQDSSGGPIPGAPNLLKFHGLDILTMLSRKWNFDRLGSTNEEASITTDKFWEEARKNSEAETGYWEGVFKNMATGAAMGFTEAKMYVGFRVEKGVDSSESATNTTKETELAQMINQQVSAGRSRFFNLAAIKETSIGQIGDTLYQGISGLLGGTLDSFKAGGGLEILKGSGFIDIPEIYESSSFTKSYTFDFQLRTPMADKISIFYSLYVPLAMLLAGAFPRAVGRNAYTSPFLVRAYCKGMFAVPLGIIDSITIKRGAPEYGWSKDMLPTQIDISFSIKDLSPVMFIALSDGSMKEWFNILGTNSAFQEYMLTLSGSDIAQRALRLGQIKKRAKILLKIAANNKFNAQMFGFSVASETKLGRLITAINPVSRLAGAVPPPEG